MQFVICDGPAQCVVDGTEAVGAQFVQRGQHALLLFGREVGGMKVREVARMILKPETMASVVCGPEGSWEAS